MMVTSGDVFNLRTTYIYTRVKISEATRTDDFIIEGLTTKSKDLKLVQTRS